MRKFEYNAVEIDDARPSALIPMFNLAGTDGWDFITIVGMIAIFKREVTELNTKPKSTT